MKRKMFLLLIIIFSLFIPTVYAQKDMQYEVLYKMENELKDNTFTIQLGLREQSTMVVMNSIMYNQDKLEFVSIDSNEYFHVTKSKEYKNGVFKSFKILADSDYGFQKVYYANVTFKIKDDFKKGERTEIYFSGNRVATADEEIKTSPSMTFTVFYDKDGTVSYVAQEQNFMTQINMFLANNWKMVLYVLGGLLLLFIIIRYVIIHRQVKEYDKQHEHNHVVKKMKFARVSKKFRTVIDEKPEKVRIAKLGKWGKKNQTIQPTQVVQQPVQPVQHSNIVNLMKEEPVQQQVQQPQYQERGYFVGNQDTGDDNMLPDDFSTFTQASNNYAYDDDTNDNSEISSEGAANLDNLTNMSLQDDNKSGNGKIGIFLAFLLVIGGLLNIGRVSALDEDQMNILRDMILGNTLWSAEYDINNDNTIDMLDIIALKDINNITIIQDTMTVADSKPQATFNLKSTSKYVRTTRNGTTKVRTTANGKWKKTTNPGGGGGGTSTSGNPQGGETPVEQETTTKQAESVDVSGDNEKKVHISVKVTNGSSDYNEITVPYGGGISFNVYPRSEGYKNIGDLYCNNGDISNNGYNITISNVTYTAHCSINFTESATINASVDINYNDADRRKDEGVINLENRTPGYHYKTQLKFDTNNYEYKSISCDGGFRKYSVSGNMFDGTVGERSGKCVVNLSPKKKKVQIKYNGNVEQEQEGLYHSTLRISMFNTSFTGNLKLYCGGGAISPISAEKTTQNISGYNFEGYRYIFDMKVENDTCELR